MKGQGKTHPEFDCADCGEKLKYEGRQDTKWYGTLYWYKCTKCDEKLVSKNGKTPEISI